ncbi:MAG: 16S rRNA (uracil(1498)-N(3))-methyltransferase [Sporolactobacillus sp.]
MQRYFIADEQFTERTVVITGEDAHHIQHVMRMHAADSIICVNGHGEAFVCVIDAVTAGQVTAVIESKLSANSELPIRVIIAQGVPKGDKFDTIVQKATECGASAFIPFQASRSIAAWQPNKVEKKRARLQRIAKEAAEQSHRLKLPPIYPPMTLRDLLVFAETINWKVVAYEETAKQGEQRPLPLLLQRIHPGDSLLVVIGPEGGLTAEEAATLEANGFILCGLGPRILRTETAPISFLSFISYHFELSLNEVDC